MLIISGPAQAVSVIISGIQDTPYAPGSRVNFTVTVDISDPDSFVPLTNLTINVTGPENLNSNFTLAGALISGSSKIQIIPVLTPGLDQHGYGYGYGYDSRTGKGTYFGYGYGYGYGYGAGSGTITFKYNVSIDTSFLPAGSYTAVASLNTGKVDLPSFDSEEANFVIAAPLPPAIISWENSETDDASLSIDVDQNKEVEFNATANQTITLWRWYVDDIDQSNNDDELEYEFNNVGSHTVKVNATNDNGTSNTVTWNVNVKDVTSPGSITGLHNISYARNYINWTWTDPADPDFSHVRVSIDGGSAFNVLKGVQFYNATGFAPDTEHTIATKTVDMDGNVNPVWVNRTDRTAPAPSTSPIRITIEINPRTINVNSSGQVKVTIDGDGIDINNINISTIRFGPNGTAVNWSEIASGKLMLFFDTPLTGINCGDTEATLTGETITGEDIIGTGSLRTKDCTIDTEISIDPSTNRTNITITRESPSGNGRIIIPLGTRARDRDGNPLISVSLNSTNLSENSRRKLPLADLAIGEPLDMGPDGATFDPPMQIRFNYTEPLPGRVREDSLKARSYNSTSDSWEILDTYEHNPDENYIIANVSHFSTFALIGTVSAETPSGGGSGGSGGGVVTSEPYDNILKAERIENSLIANKPVLYTFTVPELGVYEVAVTGAENENDISLRIEALKGTSKLVTTPAPGTVYRNVNIWAGTKRIKEALIRFRVENSWLDSNGFTGSDVVMVKWDGSKWIKLDASLSPKDGSYTYLEARTDTFSIFAITGLKGGILPPETPPVTPPGGTTVGITTGTPAPAATTSEEAPPVNLAVIAGVIAAIALAVVVYIKRKEIFRK